MENIYKKIADLGKKYTADKILLFGSRARKDHRERSDIDIAVFGMPSQNRIHFTEEINEIPTLLQFDIVFVTEKTSAALIENIKKDGIVLMNKFREKNEKFSRATMRLEEALSEYNNHPSYLSKDGVIQRFEFCTELAWKTTREYLICEGYVDLNSPRSVLRQAYADNLISDEEAWLGLLQARNLTSHIYDEETADEIFESIRNKYIFLFKELLEKLNK